VFFLLLDCSSFLSYVMRRPEVTYLQLFCWLCLFKLAPGSIETIMKKNVLSRANRTTI
jgi:hypothetical protein